MQTCIGFNYMVILFIQCSHYQISFMRKTIFFIITFVIMFSPRVIFSQSAPSLGSAASYVLFTEAGQFTSTSPLTIVIGNVGNQTGAVSAFPPGFLSGNKHFGDAVADQVSSDITSAYVALSATACGVPHAVGFGNNETLSPGVYCATGASTLTGNLTLDAGGNANAVFIIKVNGAFSTALGAQIILLNGASSCRVFWQVNGPVTLTNTAFKGILLANGAATLTNGTTVDGSILLVTGALTFNGVRVGICDISLLPLRLVNFDVTKTAGSDVQVTWITASELNVSGYEIESSVNGNDFYKIGSLPAKGNNVPVQYNFHEAGTNRTGFRFYRLKMIDKDGSFTYSIIKSLRFADLKTGVVTIFPNPAGNTINVSVNAADEESIAVKVINMQGQQVMQNTRLVNKGMNTIAEDIRGLSKGTYMLNITGKKTGIEMRQRFQKL